MRELTVHLFGGVEIYRGETLLSAFPTQKSLSLFAYLLLNRGRLVHRDTICGQFWGEQSDVEARKALRTCLWRIRSVIEPHEAQRGSFLQVEGSQIRFDASARTWVDAWEFEDSVKLCAGGERGDSEGLEGFERAAGLYRGHFLDGLHDDWCFLHRERLRLAYLTVLERIVAQHRARARWLDVIACGRQILQEDPLREHIHRALMESHLKMGDRPSALRQFDLCARTLREELDIEPMEETRQLCEKIREGRQPAPNPLGSDEAGRSETEVVGLVAEVEGTLSALYALTERLERTRSTLGHGAPPAPVLARGLKRRTVGVVAET
jgi:DNA-binding SARP family transcriptional activator